MIEEEQVPYLRIEADGYETVETEIRLTNGVEGVRDFQLKRTSAAHSIRGTVLLPDGSPAVGVEVALCTANVGVMLNGTAFEPGAFGNIMDRSGLTTAGKLTRKGHSRSIPSRERTRWWRLGRPGWAGCAVLISRKPLEIRLQPWGRIEGSVRTRDGQWADRKVAWRQTGNLTSWMTLFYKSEGFSARSDATGKFTLEHVPPGDGRVAIDDGPGTAPIFSPSIQVNPGETAPVQIGGVGRPVTGKLVAPPGIEIRSWSNQVTFAQLHVEWDYYHVPKELTGNAASDGNWNSRTPRPAGPGSAINTLTSSKWEQTDRSASLKFCRENTDYS